MPFQLVSATGDQCFELRGARALLVGRALNCDIPVFDPTISRRHAEVTPHEGGILVRDLESSNGTFVNGSRVESAEASAGDSVTFGKVTFIVRERAPTPADERRPESVSDAPRMGATIVRERPVPSARDMLARALRRSGAQAAVAGPSPTASAAPLDANGQRRLELLLEISKGLGRARDTGAMLRDIVATVFEVLEVDRAAILLVDDEGELEPTIARDAQGADLRVAVPKSIARRAVEERVAILSDNAPEDTRFGGDSIIVQNVRSAVCAPLMASEGRVLGVLYVDNLTLTHRYTEEDLGFLIAFAGIAGVAIENARFAERIRQEALVRGNFERYFAPALAERIAAEPGAARLGGDRRPVAVVFSDIRGFTTLAERMEPDEVAQLLSEYFTEMVECVFRHGGTLDKFIGDSVMAQWGAPIGAPDDAQRALAAALDMMDALSVLNERWRARGRPELGIGIGLAYGEVFAGNIGSERRLEYTVIGDTVNTASRVCAAAAAGEVLLTDEFRQALSDPPPLGADVARERLAVVEPDPDLEGGPTLLLPAGIELVQRPHHVDRRLQ
ncbi:MAG TPA: adenylate/guanylate cyclase domain-containing protein, partial [Gemmatimonadaceae bacterium]|nr:adenylate/guanylate cyclase domain-containing protein [Gemmatimonadaceae bacterium]